MKHQFLEDVTQLRDDHDTLTTLFDGLEAVLGGVWDSKFGDAVWKDLDTRVKLLGRLYDCEEDLDYWYYEVLISERTGVVNLDGKDFKLTRNPKSLWKLVKAKGEP